MNIHQLKYLLAEIVIAFLCIGCHDDNEMFTGMDNFITDFSLTQDGTSYDASFYSDSIIVTVPDGISLKGAKVSYSLSENASIKPIPDSISNWNDEMLFAVTSHNGQQQIYKYTVNRNRINTEETVILSTQEEVDAFGERGITSIKGNLIIGRMAGTDSIASLAALYQLKEVVYDITINPTYAATEITGMDALENVGGKINIKSIVNLKTIELQGLKSVGGIFIKSDSITSVKFSKLTRVMNDLSVNCPLSTLDFTNLQKVGGELSLLHSYNKGEITELSLPALKEAGSLSVARFTKAEKLELPELTTTGDLNLYYLPSLSIIYWPKLQETTGRITIPTTSNLTEVSLPGLQKAGGLSVNKALLSFDVPLLKEVSGDLELSYLPFENLSFLESLTTVEGKLSIYNFPNLTSFKAPSSLKSVGTLSIRYSSMLPPKEIDVKGLEITKLEIRGAALVDTKITGDDEFNGTLYINSDGSAPSGTTKSFPELEGFSTVDSLAFNYITISKINIKGIKKIRKGLQIPNNNITEFYMPDLEEIGGDFTINHLNRSTQETIEIPKLKTVAGSCRVSINSKNTNTLSFPALESVGGNFTLATGYKARSLTSVLFPSLKTIDGKLTVESYTGSSSLNSLMTNLDGFSALTSVEGVDITNQGVLISYEGLKNALSSFSADTWSASNNAYNPTYEELYSGQWVHP